MMPRRRSIALAFPKLRCTSPCAGRARLASKASRLSSVSMSGSAQGQSGAGPRREVIIALVPPELLLELGQARVIVDQDELDAGDLGKVPEMLGRHRIAERRVVRPSRADPGAAPGLEVRAALPDGAGDRKMGEGLGRLDDVDLVNDEPEAAAQVYDRGVEGGSRRGGEDEPGGILLPA